MVDRIGQAVEIGALVLFKVPPAFDLIWEVSDIGPSLDPSGPVGALNVKLTVTVPLLVPAGQRQVSFIRVGHSDAAAPGHGVQPPTMNASAEDAPLPSEAETGAIQAGGDGEPGKE